MKTPIAIAAFFLVCKMGFSQPEGLPAEVRNRFPDESVVFVERSATLTLTIEGDSLKAFTDVYEDMLHLKQQTDSYANRKVYGSSFVEVDKLSAKTLVWVKNRYREVPVTGWTKTSKPDDNVFYDDSYYYSFNYPSVAANNRTQLEYREIHKDVRLISGYLFSSYAPQIRSRFIVKAPREVDFYFQVRNDPGKKIQHSRHEKGNTVTYEWVAENTPTIRVEEQSPAIRYYEPHLLLYVKSFKVRDKTIRVLPDLNALHTWYRSFLRNLDEQPHPELVKVISTIRESSNSEAEVARRIFYWVQENIQYIAFEDGMRGFVPHRPSYTCEKRYGDCKDMAILLSGMFNIAGLKAYPTWIGTRDIPYRYSELPTPHVDNHMIATYISPEGRYYFLDATDKYAPFGFPSSMTQGKEALISFDDERYEVREVPVIEPPDNLITDSLSVSVDNTFLTGRGSLSLSGLSKSSVGHEFSRVEEKDIRNFVTHIAGKGSNKFYLDEYRVLDQGEKDKPTRIKYEFRIGDYFQRIGDELYINLNLSKDNYNRSINKKIRMTPHSFDHKYTKSEFIRFAIPEGYEIEYLPADDFFNGQLMRYKISYEISGNDILFRKDYTVNYLLLLPAQFGTWNDEVTRLSSAYRETVILKKKK